jgi:tRNA threonylcarbamoyladenosine biosynthesis protein TsaB
MARLPTILAFDTTAGACSAAVWHDGEAPAADFRLMTRGHAEALVPMIGRVMKEAGAGYADLDAVGVTVGPGAYTGIRIGIATARGIALAAGVPAIGVGTLQALVTADGNVLAAMDTKRGDFFVQRFVDRVPEGEPAVADAQMLSAAAGPEPVHIIGDAAAAVATILSEAGQEILAAETVAAPDAIHVGAIVRRLFRSGESYPPPEPLYLRAPQAKMPKGGGALRG